MNNKVILFHFLYRILTLHTLWLLETLFPARTSWFNLGIALNVPCETLKDIGIQHKEHSGACPREMLIIRLEEELSKEEVVAALDVPTVAQYSLAREAEQTL